MENLRVRYTSLSKLRYLAVERRHKNGIDKHDISLLFETRECPGRSTINDQG